METGSLGMAFLGDPCPRPHVPLTPGAWARDVWALSGQGHLPETTCWPLGAMVPRSAGGGYSGWCVGGECPAPGGPCGQCDHLPPSPLLCGLPVCEPCWRGRPAVLPVTLRDRKVCKRETALRPQGGLDRVDPGPCSRPLCLSWPELTSYPLRQPMALPHVSPRPLPLVFPLRTAPLRPFLYLPAAGRRPRSCGKCDSCLLGSPSHDMGTEPSDALPRPVCLGKRETWGVSVCLLQG